MTTARIVSLLATLLIASSVLAGDVSPPAAAEAKVVVLLHGLARSAGSMAPMAAALQTEGYRVCNIEYPSRDHPVAALTTEHVVPALARCSADPATPLHFVTHSLGGIIVRQLAADAAVKVFGRVVMLSPPNHGSEVIDSIGDWSIVDAVNGPAGKELGTGTSALPQRLGPAPFELGIITGDRSINLVLSTMIPGKDDGKVSVESARLDGMKDFLVLPASHPFIMKDGTAIRQTIHFLAHGSFQRAVP